MTATAALAHELQAVEYAARDNLLRNRAGWWQKRCKAHTHVREWGGPNGDSALYRVRCEQRAKYHGSHSADGPRLNDDWFVGDFTRKGTRGDICYDDVLTPESAKGD